MNWKKIEDGRLSEPDIPSYRKGMDMSKDEITFYRKEVSANCFYLQSASSKIDWMDDMGGHPYRCLPMLIANQNGWTVHLKYDILATWNGNKGQNGVRLLHKAPKEWKGKEPAVSLFGNGIVTFLVDHLVKTPQNVNIRVSGAPNRWLDGATALEGIVESDWLEYSYTMNWKITRPHQTIIFPAGFPIAYITPVPAAYIENFNCRVRHMSENPELLQGYRNYANSRSNYIDEKTVGEKDPNKEIWQKLYFKGQPSPGKELPEGTVHRTKLDVCPPKEKVRTAPGKEHVNSHISRIYF
ncbi:MAG: DUF6065 family protein [Betaproteobacteria bacterium]|jgi:hypothetical protein